MEYQKIYVVIRDEIDEPIVCRVFSTKEAAIAYVEKENRINDNWYGGVPHDDYIIEEHKLDRDELDMDKSTLYYSGKKRAWVDYAGYYFKNA